MRNKNEKNINESKQIKDESFSLSNLKKNHNLNFFKSKRNVNKKGMSYHFLNWLLVGN